MLPVRPLPGHALLRHALLCLLLLGVLLHGQAGVLRQLLGAAHWHRQAVAATSPSLPGWLDQLQAWRQQMQARGPLVGGHAEPDHHHNGSERHHHDHDATVVALETAGDSADPLADTLAGSLLQPLGLAAAPRWPATAVARPGWPPTATTAWRDAGRRLPERPPRG